MHLPEKLIKYLNTILQDYMFSVELKWHTNEQVQWPGGEM